MNDTPLHLSNPLPAPPAPGATIECRPNRDRQLTIAFFLACGWLFPIVLFCIPATSEQNSFNAATAFLVMGGICFTFAAFGNWFGECYSITADEHGLTWQSQLRRRSARWNQVEDFYELKVERGKTRRVVQTQVGTLSFTGHGGLTNTAELCEAIVKRAQWARARQWQVKGTELEPGQTLVFRYNSQSMKRGLVWITVLCFIPFPLHLLIKTGGRNFLTIPTTLAQIWSQLSWPLAIAFIFVLLSPIGLLLAMSLIPAVGWYQLAKSRQDEKVEVNLKGITFYQGATCIRAAWSEVLDYYATDTTGWFQVPRRYMVVTKRGTFDFVNISDNVQLRELIRRYATQVEAENWRYHAKSDGLDGNPLKTETTSQSERFTYRTRDNRALLLLPTLITLITFGVPSIVVGQVHPGALGFFIAIIGLCAWGWWNYYFSTIVVDKIGISKWRGGHRHFIAWKEVKDYYRSSFGDVVESDSTKISFFPIVTGGEKLRQVIQCHAACGRKEWVQH